jgi:hypothetical protein
LIQRMWIKEIGIHIYLIRTTKIRTHIYHNARTRTNNNTRPRPCT